MKIENIVFDLGNVLFPYDPGYIIDRILPNTSHKKLYLDCLFNNSIWQHLDRGDFSMEDAIQIIKETNNLDSNQETDIEKLLNHFPEFLHVDETVKEIFIALTESYPVYVLSNFQDKPFDFLLELNPFLSKAKGMTVSAKINVMKPEKDIYHHLLNTFDLTPQHSLFIDDLTDNIHACQEIGMHGIVFKSADELVQDLEQFNISIKN